MEYENWRAWAGDHPQNDSRPVWLGPKTEVEFEADGGVIVLKKSPTKLDLKKWRGRCKQSFRELGYEAVDEFIDDVRGR